MKANVSSPSVVNISDLRSLAEKRVPRMVFDYIDSGADREQTLSQNCSAFNEVYFRPRCAVATPSCDLSIKVIDEQGKEKNLYSRNEEILHFNKFSFCYSLSRIKC